MIFSQIPTKELGKDKDMQGITYLVAAYALIWAGLFAYLAVIMLRIRGVGTELAAVEALVREREQGEQGS